MKLLCDAGLAAERNFDDGITRFEIAHEHHDHLVCTRCGKIIEFECRMIENTQNEIADRYGFRVLRHRHELYGHCENCRERPRLASPPNPLDSKQNAVPGQAVGGAGLRVAEAQMRTSSQNMRVFRQIAKRPAPRILSDEMISPLENPPNPGSRLKAVDDAAPRHRRRPPRGGLPLLVRQPARAGGARRRRAQVPALQAHAARAHQPEGRVPALRAGTGRQSRNPRGQRT